jgi:hypothetical protein
VQKKESKIEKQKRAEKRKQEMSESDFLQDKVSCPFFEYNRKIIKSSTLEDRHRKIIRNDNASYNYG